MKDFARRLGARLVVLVVVGAVVAGGVYYFAFRGDGTKTVTAEFPEAVGIYEGTPVRILGVGVGTVSSVKPRGDYVAVTMTYDDRYRLPSNVTAVEVANSLVSDRYIQLTPVFRPPAVHQAKLTAVNRSAPDHYTITPKNTAGPAELDDIYAALNKLSVALGPNGANKPSGAGQQDGALSTLLKVAAANLKGNGAALGSSISNLSQAAQTLADNKGDLFGTIENLAKFTSTLKNSDAQIRTFNDQLATVTKTLADERTDLGSALHLLASTLDNVSTFVKANASRFHQSVSGLDRLVGILNKEKGSLDETLAVGTVALANLVHAYNPNLGTLSTRSNLASLTTPTQVCGLIVGLLNVNNKEGLLNNLLGGITSQLNGACTKLLGNPTLAQVIKGLSSVLNADPSQVSNLLQGLLGGGSNPLGGVIPG